LDTIHKVAQDRNINIRFGYYSLDEILATEEAGEINQGVREHLKNPKILQYVNKYIVNGEPVEIHEHYAIITCEPRTINFLIPSLHYSVLRKHGESWRQYKAFEGEFPTDEELKKIKGILIPGSHYAAYDTNVPWYKELFECIRKINREHTHINLLGICFGAQAFAQALGGRVAKMDRSFIRAGEILDIQESFYHFGYMKDLQMEKSKRLVIAEAHGDHIAELPEGAILHASSVNTKVEIYTLGTNILAFQGHPDYNEPWTTGANYRINGLVVEDFDKYADEFIKERFPGGLNQKEVLEISYKFLKKNSQ